MSNRHRHPHLPRPIWHEDAWWMDEPHHNGLTRLALSLPAREIPIIEGPKPDEHTMGVGCLRCVWAGRHFNLQHHMRTRQKKHI
jgi:hypothetical protein